MHPDSHALDASFEATGDRPDSASTASLRDQAIEDFNSFFEKLSALDNLQWSSEPPPARSQAPAAALPKAAPHAAPAAASSGPQRAASAPSASAPVNSGRVAMPGAKPRMTVVKSDSDLGPPPSAAAVAVPVGAARDRATARDVARFLKMTLVGLLLFALGLGAGWAALSLPGRFDHGMPSFARLMERASALTATRSDGATGASAAVQDSADALRVVEAGKDAGPSSAAASGAANAAGAATQARPKAATQPAHPAAAPVAARTAAKAPAAAPTPAAPKASAQAVVPAPGASATGPAADAAEAANDGETDTHGTASPDGIQLPVVSGGAPAASAPATAAAPAAGTPRAGTAPPAAATAAGAPRFTLQVGACSSYACVENYRRLLLSKVSSGSIHVLTQPRADGSGSIQRIRIEPLERARAEQLKAELTALDARFKGAYLIALH